MDENQLKLPSIPSSLTYSVTTQLSLKIYQQRTSDLKEEMEVWVKVGTSKVTGVVVDKAVPRIDHLKTAIKLELKNKFLTVDKDDIVIRDPISKEEISSTKLLNLNLIDATALGSVDNPFIVDAPQGILKDPNPYLFESNSKL
jgi:transcription elongation factor